MPATPHAAKQRDIFVCAFRTVDRVLTVFDKVIMAIACVFILGTMLVVAADAIGRYLFNQPLVFTNDLVTMYLLPACLLLPLAFTLRRGGHIAVDLFAMLMPRRMYLVVIGFAFLSSLPLIWLMAYQMSIRTHESWVSGASTFGFYSFPVWLSEIIVAISLISISIRILQIAVANLYAGLSGNLAVAIIIMPEHGEIQEEGV